MKILRTMLFCFLYILLTVGKCAADDETLSCFIRAEAHNVLGDPTKGKYYAFTFDPPSPPDRDVLQPCLVNCLMTSLCAAVLVYKDPAPAQNMDGMNEDTDAPSGESTTRCLNVVTDEAMRMEVMFGEVADLYIKRGDDKCESRDAGKGPEIPTTTAPVILAKHPKGFYNNPRVRDFLLSGGSSGGKYGNFGKPHLELNALNFLWGHQVFAHIHHHGSNTNSDDVNDSRHDHSYHNNKESKEMETTTLPSPTTPQPMVRADLIDPAPLPLPDSQTGTDSGDPYTNTLRNMYHFNNGYNGYQSDTGNRPEEPMGKEVVGRTNQIVGDMRDNGVATPDLDMGELDMGDDMAGTGDMDMIDDDAMTSLANSANVKINLGSMDTDAGDTPMESSNDSVDGATYYDTTADENANRAAASFIKDDVLHVIFNSIRRQTPQNDNNVAVGSTITTTTTAASTRPTTPTTTPTSTTTPTTTSITTTTTPTTTTTTTTTMEPTTTTQSTTTTTTTPEVSTEADDSSEEDVDEDEDEGDDNTDGAGNARHMMGMSQSDTSRLTAAMATTIDTDKTTTIAFSATLRTTMSVASTQESAVIVFDDAMLNKGDAYSTKSGVFTTPISGIYVFTVDIQSMRGTLASVKILRNDDVIHSIWANGRNTGDRGTGSGTVAVALNKGDTIAVKLFYESGYTYVKAMESRFTGFKLP